MTNVNAKRAYDMAEDGWFVFPCGTHKRPLTDNGFYAATTDLAQIVTWWTKWPDAVPAIVPGISGKSVVDIDRHPGLPDGFESAAAIGLDPQDWYKSIGGQGRHMYFDGSTQSRNGVMPGLDIKSNGGYVVVAYDLQAPEAYAEPLPEELERPLSGRNTEGPDANSAEGNSHIKWYQKAGYGSASEWSQFTRSLVENVEAEPYFSRAALLPKVEALVRSVNEGELGVQEALERLESHFMASAHGEGSSPATEFANAMNGSVARWSGYTPAPLTFGGLLGDTDPKEPEVDPKFVADAKAVERRLQDLLVAQEAERLMASRNAGMPRFWTWDELEELSLKWVVQDILPFAGLGFLVGRKNIGKSFAAVDMVCRIALGLEWFGKATDRQKVLYISGEGTNGLKARFEAWAEANGEDVHELLRSVMPVSGVNLAYDHGLNALKVAASDYGCIVIDTWATSSGSLDENNAALNSELMNRAMSINPEAATLILHHPTKMSESEASPIMRGSGALAGRADVVLTLTDDPNFQGLDFEEKHRWLQLSTDNEFGGKVRDAAPITISGVYLEQSGNALVVRQRDGQHVSRTVRKVLAYFEEGMTAQSYADAAELSLRTAKDRLKRAVDQGTLRFEEEPKTRAYRYFLAGE